MVKSRSHLSSDIFDDVQTEFADPLLADAGGVPMGGAPSQRGVQDGGLQAIAGSGPVLSSVEHHSALNDPGASTINASGGTSVTNAGQPVGTIGQLADYLVNGYWTSVGSIAHHWASNTITYRFANLNPSEQSLASAALTGWSQVANIAFVPTTGPANITFNHNGTMTAFTSSSWNGSGQMTSATVDISADWITTDGGANDGRTGIYSYGFQTYIHEIGHALGLGHQGPYNGSATYGTSNIYANDTWQFSVMSYFSQPRYDGGSYDYVITPQIADITAVQSLYGAANTRAGNTVYGFNSNAGSIYDFTQYLGTPAFTIYDSGGNDALDWRKPFRPAAVRARSIVVLIRARVFHLHRLHP